MLETMVAAGTRFPGYQLLVAGVSNLDPQLYEPYSRLPGVKVIFDSTYDILHLADAALVTSGTATLETALLNVPEVVCYRTSAASYALAKRLIKVPYISLVNLIAGKEIVRELIQHGFNAVAVSEALQEILPGGSRREQMLAEYAELRTLVGPAGASEKAGSRMVERISGS